MPAYNATFSLYYFYHIYGAEVTALMELAAVGGGGKDSDEAAYNIFRGISYRYDCDPCDPMEFSSG